MSRRKNDLSQRLEAVIKTLVPQQEQNPDDLGPMMRAIKAVHSISDHTSTTPEDLERQRAAEELFARLVTPGIGIRSTDESNQNKYNQSQHGKPCGLCFVFWRENTTVQIQSNADEARNRKAGAGGGQKRWQRDTV